MKDRYQLIAYFGSVILIVLVIVGFVCLFVESDRKFNHEIEQKLYIGNYYDTKVIWYYSHVLRFAGLRDNKTTIIIEYNLDNAGLFGGHRSSNRYYFKYTQKVITFTLTRWGFEFNITELKLDENGWYIKIRIIKSPYIRIPQ